MQAKLSHIHVYRGGLALGGSCQFLFENLIQYNIHIVGDVGIPETTACIIYNIVKMVLYVPPLLYDSFRKFTLMKKCNLAINL